MNASELMNLIEPIVVKMIEARVGVLTGTSPTGELAPSPHDLDSAHHAGALGDAQAPQFLKTDGTRTLVGNLSVNPGVTIDDVDISALNTSYTTHAGLSAVAAHGSVGAHDHLTEAAGGQLDHGAALTGLSDDDHQIYLLATGARDVTGTMNTQTLLPSATDTYDLGSTLKLWRKGYLSELDTVVFATNTITLLGGWLFITKDEGTVEADVTEVATTIDFGKAMTPDDFVLFRGYLAVEYMLVGTLVSGTTYNVTRNLDGSGANAWPKGTPFAVLGQSGQGRIELNAYDTPRIQLVEQGAAYNTQVEKLRIGDLNGNWGYGAATWGIAIGEYATSKPNITLDPTNGLRIRTYDATVLGFDTGGNASILGKLLMSGTSSAIAIGTTPPTSATSGTGIWIDRTGFYSLSSGTYQVKIDATNGKLYAGGGAVSLGASGISLTPGSFYAPAASITWGTDFYLTAWSGFVASVMQLKNNLPSMETNQIVVTAGAADDDAQGQVIVESNSYDTIGTGATKADITLSSDSYSTIVMTTSGPSTGSCISLSTLSVRISAELWLAEKTSFPSGESSWGKIINYKDVPVLTNESGRRFPMITDDLLGPFLRLPQIKAVWNGGNYIQGADKMADHVCGHHLTLSGTGWYNYANRYNQMYPVIGWACGTSGAYMYYGTPSHFGVENHFMFMGWFYIPSTGATLTPLASHGTTTIAWRAYIYDNIFNGHIVNGSGGTVYGPGMSITPNAWNFLCYKFSWVSTGTFIHKVHVNGVWSANDTDEPGGPCRTAAGQFRLLHDGTTSAASYVAGACALTSVTGDYDEDMVRHIYEATKVYFGH